MQTAPTFTTGSVYVNLGPFGYYGRNSGSSWAFHLSKNCTMLKAIVGSGNTEHYSVLLHLCPGYLPCIATRESL